MKRIVGFFIISFVAVYAFNQTGTKNFIDQNYIEVTGMAEMEIAPDEIYLSITISEKDNKAKKSLEQLEKDMYKALKDLEIDVEEDLKVIDFASNFQNHLLKKTDILTTKSYQLLCHDGRTVAMVFQKLEKLEISNINITKTDHSEIEKLRKEVKIMAVKAAKAKAGYLLEAVDQEAGKAIYIQEVNQRHWQPRQSAGYVSNAVFVMEDSISTPNIEFEKIKLEYSILARFEIQ